MALFGWCATDHHTLCRRSFTSHFGVPHECTCECHTDDKEED